MIIIQNDENNKSLKELKSKNGVPVVVGIGKEDEDDYYVFLTAIESEILETNIYTANLASIIAKNYGKMYDLPVKSFTEDVKF